LELSAAAHRVGDTYYRAVKNAERWGTGAGADVGCVELARAYLDALEKLLMHIQTLPDEEYVRTLIHTTEGYIQLVRSDLARFEDADNFLNP
jgi:hypothetical protein